MIPDPEDMDANRPCSAGDEPSDHHAADVSAASAAYLCNVLPTIAGLPAAERFERLETHFRACILAYRDCRTGWAAADPSAN